MAQRSTGGRRPNRLARSSSPYLLQHAHNPVDWREWGAEAFEEARRTDRPLFLSVGYSTCYWCHVMEREVFENEDIAKLMNEHFVCVKVDREQRPDVDEVYMAATQIATGHGGWPNSVFLTPSLKPFYAGTYFGPTDQFGRPGFPRVLGALTSAWRESRDEVEAHAEELAEVIRQALGERMSHLAPAELDRALVERCVAEHKEAYDPRDGGFGQAPKFPQGFFYPFFCDVVRREPDEQLLRMILFSLRRMSQGGMYDQIGGGFHRYSTDARWLVPHFEKMLYDQALLAGALAAAYETTGEAHLRRTASDVLAFVAREMTGPGGEFYAAIDAETHGREGQFYLWTDDELKAALSPEEFDLFAQVYGLAEIPHVPGHAQPEGGAVWMRGRPGALATELGLTEESLVERLGPIRAKLLAVRNQRERPLLDTKVVASWNGLMIEACARCFEAFGEPAHRTMAERAALFAAEQLVHEHDGRLRVWRDHRAQIPGFQEDYAALARGFLAVARITGDRTWTERAASTLGAMEERFADPESGAYFFAEPDPELIARGKSLTDGAVPSGNSIAAHAWLDLAEQSGDEAAAQRAARVLKAFAGLLGRSPSGVTHMTHALLRHLNRSGAGVARSNGSGVFRPELQGTGSGEKVRSRVVASGGGAAPGRPFLLALVLDIEPGWHVSANPAEPGLQPTVVDVRADFALASVEIEYPPPSAGVHPAGWSGRAVMLANVTPAPGIELARPAAVRVLHTFQACSDAACLAAESRITSIELPTSSDGSPVESREKFLQRVSRATA